MSPRRRVATDDPVLLRMGPETDALVLDLLPTVGYLNRACEAAGCGVEAFKKRAQRDPALGEAVRDAQRLWYAAQAEEIIRIADEPGNGTSEFESQRRTRIDARKWMLARLFRKQYGDHVDVTSDGQRLPGVLIVPAATWGVGAGPEAVEVGPPVDPLALLAGVRALPEVETVTDGAEP